MYAIASIVPMLNAQQTAHTALPFLFAAALVLGEFLSHPLELVRRRAHAGNKRALQLELNAAEVLRKLQEAAAKRRADSRLYHVIKGKCGGARSCLELAFDILRDGSNRDALERKIKQAMVLLEQAETWTHERQMFMQVRLRRGGLEPAPVMLRRDCSC